MSARAGLHRSISSKASLASLSVTSSLSRCSSGERASSSRSLGESSRAILKCRSSIGLNAATSTRSPSDQRGQTFRSPSTKISIIAKDELYGYGLLSIVGRHLSKLVVQIIHSICPELFYFVKVLGAMAIRYGGEHTYGSFPRPTSFSSFGERIIMSMESSNPNFVIREGFAGLIRHASSEEFQPKAKLIVSTEHGTHCDEQWGHFADFDCIEERDTIFLDSRISLSTLSEEGDEEEEED